MSYLIDLNNKDPKAIAKLIKESDIDLYEFDPDIAEGYAPSQKVVEPTKLDDVVESLNGNEQFSAVLNDVANNWDSESKQYVTSNPNVFKVLTEQKESGLYDKIANTIEYERMTGKLEGVSYIEAYASIEERLLSEERAKSNSQAEKKKEKFVAPRPTSKKRTDNSTKKKAATTSASAKRVQEKVNPLTMSDEELLASLA